MGGRPRESSVSFRFQKLSSIFFGGGEAKREEELLQVDEFADDIAREIIPTLTHREWRVRESRWNTVDLRIALRWNGYYYSFSIRR